MRSLRGPLHSDSEILPAAHSMKGINQRNSASQEVLRSLTGGEHGPGLRRLRGARLLRALISFLVRRGEEQLEKSEPIVKRFCVEVETVGGDMMIEGDARRVRQVVEMVEFNPPILNTNVRESDAGAADRNLILGNAGEWAPIPRALRAVGATRRKRRR